MGANGGVEDVDRQAVLDVLSLLSGKWEPIVVLTLRAEGPYGFNELLEAVSDVSGKVLSETLESLEGAGIVERRVVSEAPLRVEYDLAPAGRDLGPVFEAMSAWGARHLESTRPTVLVAGADRRLTGMYAQWLSGHYTVERAYDADEVHDLLDGSVDVVLVADDLPGAGLAALLRRVRSQCRTILLVGDRPGPDILDHPCDAVLRTPVVRATVLEVVDEQLASRGEPAEERERAAMEARRAVLEAARPEAELASVGERSDREPAGEGSR